MPLQWTRASTEQLIELYQQHECLWNIKNLSYNDRVKREKAFNVLYKSLKRNVNGITLNDIKNKVLSVRSQYRKELRAINASIRNDDAEIRIPRLWCFEQLEFLRPSVEMRQNDPCLNTCINIEQEPDNQDYEYSPDSMHDTSSSASTSSEEQISQSKRPRFDNAAQKEFSNIVKTLQEKPKRSYEWLGEQIVSTLNEMKSQDVVDEAILTIQKQIMEFKIQDRASTDQLRQQNKPLSFECESLCITQNFPEPVLYKTKRHP